MPTLRKNRQVLLAYALVRDDILATNDYLSGLLPIFQTIANASQGKQFNPNQFCEDLKSRFGLNLTSDLAEFLAPRLLKYGYLSKSTSTSGESLYFWQTQTTNPQREAAHQVRADEFVTELIATFREFNSKSGFLFASGLTDDEIADLLIEQSIGIDSDISKLPLHIDDGPARTVQSENSYIYSRFITYIGETHPELVSDLGTIRNASILAEIVLHLQNPSSQSKSKIAVLSLYIDAPLLLDAVGVTGKYSKQYTRELIEIAKGAGARVCVLDFHIEEAAHALSSFLQRGAGLRYGPTEDAVQRGEITVDFVKATRDSLTLRISDLGIVVQPTDRYANKIILARNAQEEQLQTGIYARLMGSYQNLKALDRDVDAILYVFSSRRSKTDDFFASEQVFVTRNPLLHLTANAFTRRYLGYSPTQIGTTVSAQHLAGILWLAAGPAERAEISRKQLLASCAELATANAEVVQRIVRNVKELGFEEGDNLEIILTTPRYRQIAVDAALNNVDRVTPNLTKEVVDRIFAEFDSKAEVRVGERFRAEQKIVESRLSATAEALTAEARRKEVLLIRERARAAVKVYAISKRWACRARATEGVLASLFVIVPAVALYFFLRIWPHSWGNPSEAAHYAILIAGGLLGAIGFGAFIKQRASEVLLVQYRSELAGDRDVQRCVTNTDDLRFFDVRGGSPLAIRSHVVWQDTTTDAGRSTLF